MPVSGKLSQQVNQTIDGTTVVLTDPISMVNNQQWIIKKVLVGSPIGVLLSITYADLIQYQLCIYINGNIERSDFI